MLKISVITQGNDSKYWQDTISNVWDGQVDISLQNNFDIKKDADLIILDFAGSNTNPIDALGEISPKLVGKHFLIVSDKKDADLAIEGIKLGAIGFLVKPFKRFELISALDKMHTSSGGHLPTKRKGKIITV